MKAAMDSWHFPVLTVAVVGLRLVLRGSRIGDVMSLSGIPYQHVAGILPFTRLILVFGTG
jgi:hypothetical protein